MTDPDPYQVLRIHRHATTDEIRSAYRRAVRRFHPDVYEGDPAVASTNMRVLNDAYDRLMDPARRRELDEATSERRPRTSRPSAPVHRIRRAASDGAVAGTARPTESSADSPDPRSRVAPWLLHEWEASAKEYRRPRPKLSRREKQLFCALIAIPIALVLVALTVPMAHEFSFEIGGDYPSGYCTPQSMSFPAGASVSFSWSWGLSPGYGGGFYVVGPSGQVVVSSTSAGGTSTFTSSGGSYTFEAPGCFDVGSVVTVEGQYTGAAI
jgi:hypothetical protein